MPSDSIRRRLLPTNDVDIFYKADATLNIFNIESANYKGSTLIAYTSLGLFMVLVL